MEADNKICFKTKLTLFLMNFTEEPLKAFYAFLPFILMKEMHIGIFVLSLFTMLRPVLSSFSFFWGLKLKNDNKPNLLKNSIYAWIIARVPFIFLPFINNIFYIFFAGAVYQLFYKAGLPAWTEIVKRKIQNQKTLENIYTLFSIISYVESIFLGIFLSGFLDNHIFSWKVMFSSAAIVGILPYFIQRKIDVPDHNTSNANENLKDLPKGNITQKNTILSSIKDIFILLKNRKDFLIFQVGFAIGGFALMLISPAMNIISSDVLNLSYQSFMMAKLVIMGFGYVISSYFWNSALKTKSINHLTIFVLLGFSIYILFLLLSIFYLPLFFLAFFFYGIAQAGSNLFWNISPLVFSKNENSLLFTITNLFFLGLRGLVAPLISFILCELVGIYFVLLLGAVISFFSMLYMIRKTIKKPSFSENENLAN